MLHSTEIQKSHIIPVTYDSYILTVERKKKNSQTLCNFKRRIQVTSDRRFFLYDSDLYKRYVLIK